MAYFKIWKDRALQYRLSLLGGNHEVIFTTEGYTRKQSAINALSIVSSTSRHTRVVDTTV